jgi:hypothetical protein
LYCGCFVSHCDQRLLFLCSQYIVDMIEDLKNGAIALLGETLFW